VPLVVRRASNSHILQPGRRGFLSGWFILDPRLAEGDRYRGVPMFFPVRASAEAAMPADVPYEVVDGIKRLAVARMRRIRQVPVVIAELTDEDVAELRAKK